MGIVLDNDNIGLPLYMNVRIDKITYSRMGQVKFVEDSLQKNLK